jgi:hypothetical protein
LALWALIASPLGLAASKPTALLEMEQLLEAKLAPVMHRLDPDALFFVRVYPKHEKAALPLTPFVFNQLSLEEDSSRLQVEKIEIRIFSPHEKLSPNATALLREVVSPYGHAIFVEHPMPSELGAEYDRRLASNAPPPAEKTWDMMLAHTRKELVDHAPVWIGLAVTFGIFVFFTLLGYISRWRQGHGLVRAVDRGIEKISSALETRPSATSSATPAATARETAAIVRRVRGAEVPFLNSLPLESLSALIADCYWSSLDSYGSFLWQGCSASQRQAMLQKLDFAEAYSYFIGGLPGEDFGADQEACFLSPLPIHHLDNKALTEIIRKHPGLLYRISSLRRSSLALSAPERVTLTREAISKPVTAVPDFTSLRPSPKRELKRILPIPIRSIEEEQELLKLPGLTADLKRSIQSLGWLSELPAAQIQEILKPFAARELAEAWIGPPAVLAKLEAALPESKLKLVQSYGQKVAPNRNSPCFQTLHRLSLEARRPTSSTSPSLRPTSAA